MWILTDAYVVLCVLFCNGYQKVLGRPLCVGGVKHYYPQHPVIAGWDSHWLPSDHISTLVRSLNLLEAIIVYSHYVPSFALAGFAYLNKIVILLTADGNATLYRRSCTGRCVSSFGYSHQLFVMAQHLQVEPLYSLFNLIKWTYRNNHFHKNTFFVALLMILVSESVRWAKSIRLVMRTVFCFFC